MSVFEWIWFGFVSLVTVVVIVVWAVGSIYRAGRKHCYLLYRQRFGIEPEVMWSVGWRRKTRCLRALRLWWIAYRAGRRAKASGYLTAYKWATVVRRGQKLQFQPFVIHRTADRYRACDPYYDVESRADCVAWDAGGHTAPYRRCRCGFYGLKSPRLLGWLKGAYLYQPLREQAALVLLRVDMSGRVIEGRYGYRAEQQRVEQVLFGRACAVPDDAQVPCSQPAVGLMELTRESQWPAVIAPACGNHASTELTLLEVAGQLGTEVSWQ